MHADPDQPDRLPRTLAELPFFVSGRFPKPGLIGRCTAEAIDTTSGRDLVERVRDISLGLSALGMEAGDRVVVLSESRPEWLFVDLAILAAGAATTPIYPTVSQEQLAFILRDCGARIAVVSNQTLLDKLIRVGSQAPELRSVVLIDRSDRVDHVDSDGASHESPTIRSLTGVMAAGHRQMTDGWGIARGFHDRARAVRPADLATVIYTSGTTGEAKGVPLTHANLIANLADLTQAIPLSDDDVALSFLPLCHAFERIAAYLYLVNGVSLVFAESIETIARDLQRVRPTVMTGVPRVFEKMLERVHAAGQAGSAFDRWVFARALRLAETRGARDRDGRHAAVVRSWQGRVADRLVFRKVREGLGGRLRFVVCGSAPLAAEIGRIFLGMGVPILEGYGLTETSPAISVNPLNDVRFGTVGKALPSVDVRVADDGELLVRGPNVMAGYYRRTEEAADVLRDGWLHTGDIGSVDGDGYIRITDRKKNLLVTSGGKKLAPQPLEAALRSDPLIAEAVVIGDGRRFPAALVVPDFTALAKRIGAGTAATGGERRALVVRGDVRALYQALVDAVNAPLAQFERIKRFTLLTDDFSIESGHLTATLKVKRRVVEERYREAIDALYRESEPERSAGA